MLTFIRHIGNVYVEATVAASLSSADLLSKYLGNCCFIGCSLKSQDLFYYCCFVRISFVRIMSRRQNMSLKVFSFCFSSVSSF